MLFEVSNYGYSYEMNISDHGWLKYYYIKSMEYVFLTFTLSAMFIFIQS